MKNPAAQENPATGGAWKSSLQHLGLVLVSAIVVWALVRVWNARRKEPPLPPPTVARVGSATTFAPTRPNDSAPLGSPLPGMVWIPGGEFSMGCVDPREMPHGGPDPMADARPIHRVYVDGFWMDQTEVTNAQFTAFVKASGYVTVAERTPKAEDFPGAPLENLVAGSVVFTPPPESVLLNNHFRWWSYVKAASWRHPEGSKKHD